MNGSNKLAELVRFAQVQTEGQVDDFDIHDAIWWYANDYHCGQGCELYEVLSCSPFSPGRAASAPATCAAHQVYGLLVAEYETGSVN
jgi:hypothetical protein